ncbi:MAG: sigma-70 family RNA polymerase sigma factor [Chitinophagaceae bacterium]
MAEKMQITEQASDEYLMALATQGRRSAFEVLYDRYFQKLTWYAYGMLRDVQRSEDLVQDVFCVIIDKPESFDPSKTFSTWIYTLVGNRCRNELRNVANRSALMKEQVTGEVSEQPAVNGDRQRLRQKIDLLLGTLTEKERQIYQLRFEQDLKVREIAAITGIPEGSVKSGIFYLLQKLSHHLKEFSYAK